MNSYANIMQGISFYDAQRTRYFHMRHMIIGDFSQEAFAEFLNTQQLTGEPLQDFASRLMGLYNLSGRKVTLNIFNLSEAHLEKFQTWDLIASEFQPVLEINAGLIRRLNTTPMNLSTDQVKSFESLCKQAMFAK